MLQDGPSGTGVKILGELFCGSTCWYALFYIVHFPLRYCGLFYLFHSSTLPRVAFLWVGWPYNSLNKEREKGRKNNNYYIYPALNSSKCLTYYRKRVTNYFRAVWSEKAKCSPVAKFPSLHNPSYWHSCFGVSDPKHKSSALAQWCFIQNSNFLISVMNEPDDLLSPVQSPVLERQSHSKMAE